MFCTLKKKITFVIHSFTCIWLPSNPDHHNHSRGPSISHRAVEKSFFFFFKHRCPFPQNNRTKLLLVAHRRHFTHIFILQIWLLPTSLTSYLGCFLFTVLSHSFLTTLCLSAPGHLDKLFFLWFSHLVQFHTSFLISGCAWSPNPCDLALLLSSLQEYWRLACSISNKE